MKLFFGRPVIVYHCPSWCKHCFLSTNHHTLTVLTPPTVCFTELTNILDSNSSFTLKQRRDYFNNKNRPTLLWSTNNSLNPLRHSLKQSPLFPVRKTNSVRTTLCASCDKYLVKKNAIETHNVTVLLHPSVFRDSFQKVNKTRPNPPVRNGPNPVTWTPWRCPELKLNWKYLCCLKLTGRAWPGLPGVTETGRKNS